MSVGAVVGIVVCMAALVVAALLASNHPSSSSRRTTLTAAQRAQRAALTSWEMQIHPAVLSAGQVVALGPRQGVSEVANHTQPAMELESEAIGWHARLVVLRQQIAAVSTPAFLQPAHDLLDRAMTDYVGAARALFMATTARGGRRTSLLAAATAHGRAADHLYDEAVAAVAGWRTRLGLGADWSGS